MSKNIEQANIKIQSLKNTLKRIERLSSDYYVMVSLEKKSSIVYSILLTLFELKGTDIADNETNLPLSSLHNADNNSSLLQLLSSYFIHIHCSLYSFLCKIANNPLNNVRFNIRNSKGYI